MKRFAFSTYKSNFKTNPAPIKPQQTTICYEDIGGELSERLCHTMLLVREASCRHPE
jgi:hypothetical protein